MISNNRHGQNMSSKHSPEFSLLIVNLNGIKSRVLLKCLDSIEEYAPKGSQIIIVDNGSTDESVASLREFKSRYEGPVLIILNDANVGPSAARKQAEKYLIGNITLLLDNDAYVTASTFRDVSAKFSADPALAIAQPLLVINRSKLVDYAGDYITATGILQQVVEPSTEPSIIPNALDGQFILSAKSAGLFIRTSSLLAIGGFEDWFFIYCEETDIGWRCWLNGFHNKLFLHNVVNHEYGSSSISLGTATVAKNSAYYGARNYSALIYLNEIGVRRYAYVSSCIILWLAFSISCLFRLEVRRGVQQIRGVIDFFINVPKLNEIRRKRCYPTPKEYKEIRKKIYRKTNLYILLTKAFRRPVLGNSIRHK